MRRLSKRRRERGERETTIPLINIVFLLLVFFLVAGTLSVPQDGAVDPATADAFAATTLDPQAIYLDAEGNFRVAGEPTTATGALAGLAAAAAAERGREGGVSSDRGAPADTPLILVPDRRLDAALLLARLAELRAATDRPIRILTRRPDSAGP